MRYPSQFIEDAVHALAGLPGVGKKTALRLTLFLLKTPKEYTTRLTTTIQKLRDSIRYCIHCHNVADENECRICTDKHRDRTVICIVENIQDVLAVEHTGQYKGLYHVLGGVISPLEGIGPERLNIASLLQRTKYEEVREIIFALPATIEGDTTIFYIKKQLQGHPIRVSTIARGVAVGGELEYTDTLTLGRSITNRITYV